MLSVNLEKQVKVKIGLEQELSYESRSVAVEYVWRETRYCWWSYFVSIVLTLHNHCSDYTKWSRIAEKVMQEQLHVGIYICVERTKRISRKSLPAVMSPLTNFKFDPSVGWNSGPEGIYWPTEGQAVSSLTVHIKFPVFFSYYDHKATGEFI
jgi:hypothetical protein